MSKSIKLTLEDCKKEIARIELAIEKTESNHLRRDYGKYLGRLKKHKERLEKT